MTGSTRRCCHHFIGVFSFLFRSIATWSPTTAKRQTSFLVSSFRARRRAAPTRRCFIEDDDVDDDDVDDDDVDGDVDDDDVNDDGGGTLLQMSARQ